ncbi:hypothetical protein RND81_09G263400 [Saponaria officinalis]|uniref:IQ domain-containing protein IQM2-like n=1 Tax=Saponaria officinalis TaxID=3572 RepID=A0AAW1IRD1_SAPOF
MGVSYSLTCPLASDHDLDSALESIIVKSVSLGDDLIHTPQRSISFNSHSHPLILHKSSPSGNIVLQASVSFKQRDSSTFISVLPTTPPPTPKHQAALKLQKVYKSFRTRRKLADCAVLVEQSWWKLLDFAELKHSSISFFDIQHHETAISRWSRAKTRAAKVGKGLSKNDKAQKLALQHWLEAIDPRHRYGHNLHFYYTKWLESQSREPFFYWLDIGEGREVNLEKCSRCKLQQQCIKYLGPMERKAYEVAIKDGKFYYKESGEILDTSYEPHAKWIFVLSTSKSLYVSKKKKGTFQHSSFLAGGATSAAGRLVVENGILKAVWPHSGHYRPTPENFQEFVAFLTENNVDLTDVKMDPVDDEEQSLGKQRSSLHFRNSSEEDLGTETVTENEEGNSISTATKTDALIAQQTAAVPDNYNSQPSRFLSPKLSNLQIPTRGDLFLTMQSEKQASISSVDTVNIGDAYGSSTKEVSTEANDRVEKEGILIKEEEEKEEMIRAAASILERINSHKETKSYQLGKQLSCKWSTGAGPRIGCVRDYPSELQLRALEQVNLSPRSGCAETKTFMASYGDGLSPRALTPLSVVSRRNMEQSKVQVSSSLSKGRKHK